MQIRMRRAMEIKNEKTGDVQFVKAGWSWDLFLFSGFFGIPWFFRGVKLYGLIGLFIGIYVSFCGYVEFPELFDGAQVVESLSLKLILVRSFLITGFCIFGGIKGNEITIKNYYKSGYRFVDPTSEDVIEMNKRYRIF